jgi:hypothetical protein
MLRGTMGIVLALLAFNSTVCDAEPLKGPGLVCFKYSTFQLLAGETVTEQSGSPEATMIKVAGSAGSYEIGESEIFATPRGERELVDARNQTKVFLIMARDKLYGVYGPTPFSTGGDRLVIRLSGRALRWDARDAAIYQRFEVRKPPSSGCRVAFAYSWDQFLPPR